MSPLAIVLLLGAVTALPLQAPTPAAAGPQDLTLLSVDALIDRLPPVGEEWLREEDRWSLVPAAKEMKARLERGEGLSPAQWRRALIGTGALRSRERWPAEQPFALSMRSPGWLAVTQVRLVPRRAGLAPAEVGLLYRSTCGTFMGWKEQEWSYQELGTLPVGRHHLVFDVTVERGSGFRSAFFEEEEKPAPPGVLWTGELALDVEVMATVDQAVPPASSPVLDEAVRRSISLAFDDWSRGRTAILVVDPDIRGDPGLAGLGLSLSIDVLLGSALRESVHLIPSTRDPLAGTNSVHATRNQPISFCALESPPPALERDPTAQAAWSVRVRGTSQQVWGLWEARRRWEGELWIPLSELIEREHELAPEGRRSWVWTPSWR
ncbi:MAG TPA: hypothetical protein VF530_21185 [Planctomycetota bacterium]